MRVVQSEGLGRVPSRVRKVNEHGWQIKLGHEKKGVVPELERKRKATESTKRERQKERT